MILATSTVAAARALPPLSEPMPAVELSIEVFPPKGPEAAARLWANLEQFVAASRASSRSPAVPAARASTARCRWSARSRTASGCRSRRI